MTGFEQFLVAMRYCIFMLILCYIFKKNPPKKINEFYGYRTRRAMANETIWKAANSYATAFMIKMCLYSFVFPVLGYLLFPDLNVIITITANTLLIVSVMWFTEKHLDKSFDKNGNPK